MKNITKENIPCWYELFWKEPVIGLRIHKDFIESDATRRRIRGLNTDGSPISKRIEILKKDFGFKDFVGGVDGDFFGFNQAFCRSKNEKEFVEYSVRLSGENSYATSATLAIFSEILKFPEDNAKLVLPQLLTVVGLGTGGNSFLFGDISVPLANWFREKFKKSEKVEYEFPEVIQAMKNAYLLLADKSNVWEYEINISVVGGIILGCPGNACYIHQYSYIEDGKGYQFSSHNVDHPWQQLTLLAGLAALHEMARRDLARI